MKLLDALWLMCLLLKERSNKYLRCLEKMAKGPKLKLDSVQWERLGIKVVLNHLYMLS